LEGHLLYGEQVGEEVYKFFGMSVEYNQRRVKRFAVKLR